MITLKYLTNYAEWYYTKYFPSMAMLRKKLQFKWADDDQIDAIFTALSSLFVEDKIIESIVHSLLEQGRSRQYIVTQLKRKLFDSSLIASAISQEEEKLQNPHTYARRLENLIHKWRQKWASKRSLTYELTMLYPDAKSSIPDLLADYDDENILDAIMPDLAKKYPPEKLIQKLSQKGFSVSDIYACLRRIR